ncbi:MAG: trigger factor [Candidatus Bipolaricaulota bacterium]|nr:trigger factor [Candidatus Bipolaricaulota bacterium]
MTSSTQYEIKTREATQATIQIAVPHADVEQQVESVYSRYAREVHVPGFRRGHVPREYFESRFGRDSFVAEAKEDLERKHVPLALKNLDLDPVSVPHVDEVAYDEAQGLVFTASFAVLPIVELPTYRGLEVTIPALPEVADDDVDRALEEVREQFATLAEKEGTEVADGDVVRVREKGQEWDTRAQSANPVTGKLVGKHIGEAVAIDAEISEGKRIQTSLEVRGLRQVVTPTIDDELAKDAGFEGLDALKNDIRARLNQSRSELRRRALEAQLVDTLVTKAAIPLPEVFVTELLDEELEKIKDSLADSRSSLTFEDYLKRRETTEEDFRKGIRESIELRLRRELILRKLAEAEKIVLDDAELEEAAKRDAEEAGEDPLRFAARLRAEDRWSEYRSSKVNERVLNVLCDHAVVKEVELPEIPAKEE